MDKTFESELPSWIHEQFSGNPEEEPIFLDAEELGLTPCLDCEHILTEEEIMLYEADFARKLQQIYYDQE